MTTENNNIRVIESTLIFDKCYSEYYINSFQNKNNYVVMHDDCSSYWEYIDCLLLNIDIFDYLKTEYLNIGHKYFFNDSNSIKSNDFNMFHYNGFLGINYNKNNKQNINQFFKKYGKYFLEGLEPHIIKLYDKVNKEITKRYNLGELYSFPVDLQEI